MAIDFNKFNFSSTNNIDKVLYENSGSVSTSGSNIVTLTPTNSDVMLIQAFFSLDNSNWYEECTLYNDNSWIPKIWVYSTYDNGKVKVNIYYYTGTVYYRVVGVKL